MVMINVSNIQYREPFNEMFENLHYEKKHKMSVVNLKGHFGNGTSLSYFESNFLLIEMF